MVVLIREVSDEFKKAILLSLAYQDKKYVKEAFDYAIVTTYRKKNNEYIPCKSARVSKRSVKVEVYPSIVSIRVYVPKRLLRKISQDTYKLDRPIKAVLYKDSKEVLSLMLDNTYITVSRKQKLHLSYTVWTKF